MRRLTYFCLLCRQAFHRRPSQRQSVRVVDPDRRRRRRRDAHRGLLRHRRTSGSARRHRRILHDEYFLQKR